ncbi:MAG: iron-containing alcohol dehydrogenase [Chloroflexi bacterium]|nr:iron-containing alcohol dehydrogenase [Chloroflexota bacterium]MCL5076168.1 iron-containing alcohol dehydrogenase [Chloroflexota bacterium]
MLPEFSFHLATQIIFGKDVFTVLATELSRLEGSKVLLVSDAGLAEMGLVARLTEVIQEAGLGVATFTEVHTNPTVESVEKGQQLAQAEGTDLLVALGGGSAIDVAKAIALLLSAGGEYRDYQWGGKKVPGPLMPLVAIPTTAGTGAEVSKVAVIVDEAKHSKQGVVSPFLRPRLAIIDPRLMLSLPPRLTAATGVDAFVHALEAYVGLGANPLSDLFALEALAKIWRWLPQVIEHGDNLEGRKELALASLFAGIAMDQAGLGIMHALAGPLCGHFNIHHGVACALVMSPSLAFNLEVGEEKLPLLCQSLAMPQGTDGPTLACRLKEFVAALKLPVSLGEVGVREGDIPLLAREALQMGVIRNNPRPTSEEDCQAILRAIL